jgi:cyclic pyranopterin phosphate synthase
MPGAELPRDVATRVLDNAAALGIHTARIYGGEPLVHPHVVAIVEHAIAAGFRTWVSTNGFLLHSLADRLYEVGLRRLAIPLYGTGPAYDSYVQSRGAFARLTANIDHVRARFSNSVQLDFSFLLAAPFCSVRALEEAWAFCERYCAEFHVDIVHTRLPYFTSGPDRYLEIGNTGDLGPVIDWLIKLRRTHPDLYREPVASIRSIRDWVEDLDSMFVPCDMYNHIWIGPDGSVQLCYAAFYLGNVLNQPLEEILYSERHREAARMAFKLACPRCPCNRITRIARCLSKTVAYSLNDRSPVHVA